VKRNHKAVCNSTPFTTHTPHKTRATLPVTPTPIDTPLLTCARCVADAVVHAEHAVLALLDAQLALAPTQVGGAQAEPLTHGLIEHALAAVHAGQGAVATGHVGHLAGRSRPVLCCG